MRDETAFWAYVGLVAFYVFLTIVRVIVIAFESWREKHGKSEN